MLRHVTTTIVGIVGLSLAMCLTLLTYIYVQYEMSYDSFHSKRDVIYQFMIQQRTKDERLTYSPFIPLTLSEKIRKRYLNNKSVIKTLPVQNVTTKDSKQTHMSIEKAYPQLNLIEQPASKYLTDIVQMMPVSGSIHSGKRSDEEHCFYFTDPSIFRVFDFELDSGDPQAALTEAGSVVLSPEMVKKYFPEDDPIDKQIIWVSSAATPIQLKVTGVLNQPPQNSSINIHFLAYLPPSELREKIQQDNPMAVYTFFEFGGVKRKRQPSILETILKDLIIWYRPIHVAPVAASFQEELIAMGADHFPGKHSGIDSSYTLISLKESYFAEEGYSDLVETNYSLNRTKSNRLSLIVLLSLSLLVLGISCINVINLFTARSAGRSKEIAIRKVLGAERSNLVFQFLAESVLLSFISVLIALSLVEILLPGFNHVMERDLTVNYVGNWGYLSAILTIVLLTGVFSGIYPAIFLSSFAIVETLKGTYPKIAKNFRAILVICQMSISACILIFTLYHVFEHRQAGTAETYMDLDQKKTSRDSHSMQNPSPESNEKEDRDHSSYNQWSKSLKIASVISVCLAAFGIQGFAQYEVERKTKEIGIRRALGASRTQLCVNFIIRFLPLILTANIIAYILSLLILPKYLKLSGIFPLSSIGLPVFLCSCTLTLLIFLTPVGLQIFIAASATPASALRDE